MTVCDSLLICLGCFRISLTSFFFFFWLQMRWYVHGRGCMSPCLCLEMYRRSPCARGRVHFDFSEEVIRKLHATNHSHPHRLELRSAHIHVFMLPCFCWCPFWYYSWLQNVPKPAQTHKTTQYVVYTTYWVVFCLYFSLSFKCNVLSQDSALLHTIGNLFLPMCG